MSTLFVGEGNIGSVPEFQEFNSNPDEPRRLLRLNVYFDNPVPREGGYEDRGGYWAPVELWHRDAEHWSTLYQKGMRVWSKAARSGGVGRQRGQRAGDLQGRGPAHWYPAASPGLGLDA